MSDSKIGFSNFECVMTGPNTCTVSFTSWVTIPYIEVTFTLEEGPKCPLCGYPAELVFNYHCTNSECQNYDAKLIEPCPEAGEDEFDDPEDTLELFPCGYNS